MVKLAFSFAIGIALIASSHQKSAVRFEKNQFLMPPKDLQHFVLGYNDIVADSLWLRVIQDFDVCDGASRRARSEEVLGIEEKLKLQETQANCSKGWVYHMIESITEIAPKFRIPYVSGGLMLSTAIQDYAGATAIYKKGVERFPDDWHISYYAAYHAMTNEKDNDKAADLLLRAARHGAPTWVFTLAAKLYTRVGRAQFAKKVLLDWLQENPDERWAPAFKQRLEQIERDLQSGQSD